MVSAITGQLPLADRATLGNMGIRGRVVIGEGERDEAPMLFIGEEVGAGLKTGSGRSWKNTASASSPSTTRTRSPR